MSSATPSSLGPMNAGNVVSAALRLYRDRFKTYFKMAAFMVLWAFVPVYGWAKISKNLGVMSRLTFRELINQPETAREAQRQLEPKKWQFLLLYILFLFISSGAIGAIFLGGFLAATLAGGLIGGLLGAILGQAGIIIGTVVAGLILFLVIVGTTLWLFGRLLVSEVPIAVEDNVGPVDSLGRSWELSKQSVRRIIFVQMAAYVITLPISLVFSTLPSLLSLAVEPGSAAYWLLFSVSQILSLLVSLLLIPFWQIIKGIVYYDLRSRREGIDLGL